MKRKFDPMLYLVIGPENCLQKSMFDVVKSAIRGGVTMIQYRNKHDDEDIQTTQVKELLSITRSKKIPLIVNDKISVAIASNADGVHLGQSDTDIKAAREFLGENAIIGLTVKNSAHIKSAPIKDLDYLGIGGVFPTSSKVNPAPPLGLNGLTALVTLAREVSDLPLTAIAGIDGDNCEDVMNCGVDGIAIVSAICASDTPDATASILHNKLEKIITKRNNHA